MDLISATLPVINRASPNGYTVINRASPNGYTVINRVVLF